VHSVNNQSQTIYEVSGARPEDQAFKKLIIHFFECSPPRKSLVKGERFFRVEGEPKLVSNDCSVGYIQSALSRSGAVC